MRGLSRSQRPCFNAIKSLSVGALKRRGQSARRHVRDVERGREGGKEGVKKLRRNKREQRAVVDESTQTHVLESNMC